MNNQHCAAAAALKIVLNITGSNIQVLLKLSTVRILHFSQEFMNTITFNKT